ncbi:cysteine-rich receptor-like protein kinase [Trifolium pratense]|uniref:Cysteine-rich receptor-like protein kinase n=1 Tax=Trifolium pratense TaxID=57577 RepID=A0A2K3LXA4_TRIPR|nr:cysteine-rich receptor-like protein kinase [Trifolium pratense]
MGNLYKILMKVLANKLRLVIGSVISESRTAFVKDRQILDGILIANEWIKECVCTTTASVLVNGSSTKEFPLERGLRQGDLLSPFLFLLAAEGLNLLMEFSDDTLLLGVKSWANVRALRVVLVLFETMSGLKVNFNNIMLVGVNIPDSWLGEVASVLGCKLGKVHVLYL